MGLLDDAIREHLDLKRRHGADPSEVERQEQEALGPARRGAAPVAGDVEDDFEAGAVSAGLAEREEPAGAPYDDDADADYDEDDYEEDDEPAPSVPAGEPEAPVAPPAPSAPRDAADDPAVLDADDVPDVDPEPPPEPEVSGSGSRSAEDPGEDVLEETPDFLQETPEHDRLWFEQKPPRDFEF
jgi:hypothetical protein